MSYTKTTWVANQAPAITAANLNNIENGIENAHKALGIQGAIYNKFSIPPQTMFYNIGEGGSVVYANPELTSLVGGNNREVTLKFISSTKLTVSQYPFSLPFDYKTNGKVKINATYFIDNAVTLGDVIHIRLVLSKGVSTGAIVNRVPIVDISTADFATKFIYNDIIPYNKYILTYEAKASELIDSSMNLMIEFQRVYGSSAESGSTVFLSQLEIIYEVDGNGSTSQTSKVKTW